MGKSRSSKPLSFRILVPNFVTIMALCAGLTSVRFGLEGRYGHALLLIVLAAILDGLDGRLARLLDGASDFGAELDTLADFFNFGIAPGLLIYNVIYAGTTYVSIGWLAVMFLCICCALRLARFNVSLQAPDDLPVSKNYFVGVPAPALACLALLPMFLLMAEFTWVQEHPVPIFLYLLLVAGLAVSKLPTYSIKHLRINPDRILLVLRAVHFIA